VTKKQRVLPSKLNKKSLRHIIGKSHIAIHAHLKFIKKPIKKNLAAR